MFSGQQQLSARFHCAEVTACTSMVIFSIGRRRENARMKIKMKLNGQEVGAAGGLDHLVLDQVKRSMQEKVAGLTCSEHMMAAVIQVNGESLSGLKVQIQACCDAMRQRVAKALA